MTSLFFYNIGYVTNQIGLLVICGSYVVDKKNNTWWQETAGDMLNQNETTSALKKPVRNEKDTTVESDSRQNVVPLVQIQ